MILLGGLEIQIYTASQKGKCVENEAARPYGQWGAAMALMLSKQRACFEIHAFTALGATPPCYTPSLLFTLVLLPYCSLLQLFLHLHQLFDSLKQLRIQVQ